METTRFDIFPVASKSPRRALSPFPLSLLLFSLSHPLVLLSPHAPYPTLLLSVTMVAAPILETPSKVAAAVLEKLDLTKPSSLTDKLNAAKEFVVAAPAKQEVSRKHKSAEQVDELQNDGRDRFVGNPAITCDADEPILKANDKRFVLFPIQYHEVSFPPSPLPVIALLSPDADLLHAFLRSGASTSALRLPSGPLRRWYVHFRGYHSSLLTSS